jgi:hypothetical protein
MARGWAGVGTGLAVECRFPWSFWKRCESCKGDGGFGGVENSAEFKLCVWILREQQAKVCMASRSRDATAASGHWEGQAVVCRHWQAREMEPDKTRQVPPSSVSRNMLGLDRARPMTK